MDKPMKLEAEQKHVLKLIQREGCHNRIKQIHLGKVSVIDRLAKDLEHKRDTIAQIYCHSTVSNAIRDLIERRTSGGPPTAQDTRNSAEDGRVS